MKPDSLWKNRNFVLVFLGALVSNVAAMLYSFAVSFYILAITDNNAILQGTYLALTGIVMVALSLFGGVLGDRVNKGTIMFVCDYIKGALVLATAFLLYAVPDFTAQLVFLFVFGVLGSAASAIFTPAGSSILPFIVPEGKLQQANSYGSMLQSVQSIAGVILAGVLYAVLPVPLLFLIVGAGYVASGVSEMFIRYEQPSCGKMTVKGTFADLASGFRYLLGERAIFAIALSALFINFFFSPVSANFFPYFIASDIAGAEHYLFDAILPPEMWEAVFTVGFGLGSVAAGAVISGKKQREKYGAVIARRILYMALLLLALATLFTVLFAVNGWLDAFLVAMTVGTVGMGALVVLVNVPLNTVLQSRVEKDVLSKVSSLVSATAQGLIPLSGLLAGVLLSACGETVLLFTLAGGLLLTAVFMLCNRHVKEI